MYQHDQDQTKMILDDLGTLFPLAGAAFSQCTKITKIDCKKKTYRNSGYGYRYICSSIYISLGVFILVLGTNAESRASRGLDRTKTILAHLGTGSWYTAKHGSRLTPSLARTLPASCARRDNGRIGLGRSGAT